MKNKIFKTLDWLVGWAQFITIILVYFSFAAIIFRNNLILLFVVNFLFMVWSWSNIARPGKILVDEKWLQQFVKDDDDGSP